MLRQAVNEIEITVEIQGHGHLLVKDGRYDKVVKNNWAPGPSDEAKKLRAKLPDMIFISHTPLDALQEKFVRKEYDGIDYYIPGSSIRGSWRSHLEKVLRSLGNKVCDPLSKETDDLESCSTLLVNDQRERPPFPYSHSCPVCRLFGNTATASRLLFSDATKLGGTPEMVDNVAISRQTGSVLAPFKSVALRDARFTFDLRLRNFELWQVGLLAHLFTDLAQQRVPLGSGKNKGFGQVTAKATSIGISYFGLGDPWNDGKLKGLAELLNTAQPGIHGPDPHDYDLKSGSPPVIVAAPVQAKSSLWRHTRAVPVESIPNFWTNTKPCFNEELWNQMPDLSARWPQPAGGKVATENIECTN